MVHVHHQWLAEWQQDVQADYQRLHGAAQDDVQAAGHGGEATWVRLLEAWLPPAYKVGTRKYIVPEEGSETFETDIVVFTPGYPERLRARHDVLAGGVAAAFSVKLTLDVSGLQDAVSRGARLRRAMRPRLGTPRLEMLGAFPFGLLAHSHVWQKPGSTPRANLERNLSTFDRELVSHPREGLDLVCVADLTSVRMLRAPYMPNYNPVQDGEARPATWRKLGRAGDTPAGDQVAQESAHAETALSVADSTETAGPIATFVAGLIERLALADPALLPFADGLRLTGTGGSGRGTQRRYELHEVFSQDVCEQLPRRGRSEGDWRSAFF